MGFALYSEFLQLAIQLAFLTDYYNRWSDNIDFIKQLSEKYTAKGCEAHEAEMSFRGRDQATYDFVNSTPVYESCDSKPTHAIAAVMQEINATHRKALIGLPAWDAGSRHVIQREASRAYITLGALNIADAKNKELARELDSQQAHNRAILSSTATGSRVDERGFRVTAQLGNNALARSTAGLNDAAGSFGRTASSLVSRYRNRSTFSAVDGVDSQLPGANQGPNTYDYYNNSNGFLVS